MEDFLSTNNPVLDGKRAFELYDTYGFPIDLTALIMRENSRKVDMDSFSEETSNQKQRSRAATKLSTRDFAELPMRQCAVGRAVKGSAWNFLAAFWRDMLSHAVFRRASTS